MDILIPYKPRPPQDSIHPQLESHRFNVLVAHRRLGKTVMAINHVIKQAWLNEKESPQYAYLAPYLKQAKLIAWNYLLKYTSVIPGIKVNMAELWVEMPSRHRSSNLPGSRIYIIGADNPDALRGTYWDGAILDEYAQIRPELWSEVLFPALTDRDGWALFLGTPKGLNQFHDIYQSAQQKMAAGDPLWFAGLYRADETGVLSTDQLKLLRDNLPADTYRQEFLCDFTASSDNVLITIDTVSDAAAKVIPAQAIEKSVKILGVDCARFGSDASVIIRRQGRQAFIPKVFHGLDLMQFASMIGQEIDDWNPDAVFVDEGGLGGGVVDRLRQLGYDIVGVNFGAKAIEEARFANKRCEIWYKMAEWMNEGASIPNDAELKTDLVTPTYSYDPSNRIKLESKDDIKKRGGRSPDIGDALALTFAYPVQPKGRAGMRMNKEGQMFSNTKYEMFGRK